MRGTFNASMRFMGQLPTRWWNSQFWQIRLWSKMTCEIIIDQFYTYINSKIRPSPNPAKLACVRSHLSPVFIIKIIMFIYLHQRPICMHHEPNSTVHQLFYSIHHSHTTVALMHIKMDCHISRVSLQAYSYILDWRITRVIILIWYLFWIKLYRQLICAWFTWRFVHSHWWIFTCLFIHLKYHAALRPEYSAMGILENLRKIAGCACTGNAGNVFPAFDFEGNR